MTTLDKLSTRLGVAERQLRVSGNRAVAIAGMRGHIQPASYGSDMLN